MHGTYRDDSRITDHRLPTALTEAVFHVDHVTRAYSLNQRLLVIIVPTDRRRAARYRRWKRESRPTSPARALRSQSNECIVYTDTKLKLILTNRNLF